MSGTESQAAAAAAAAGQGERGGGGRGRGCYFSTEEILSYTAAAAVNIAITIHLAGKCKSALMRKQSMLLPFQCAVVFCVVKKCQYGCCIACSPGILHVQI